jgi:hypothetical protein
MGLSLSDIGGALNPFDKSNPIFGKGGVIDDLGRTIDDKLLGGDASDAAKEAAALQATAGQQASALLDPFKAIGESGLSQAGFLTDPQAQFDFLQSNPLFQLGLDNLNLQTNKQALASGRVGTGDTSQQIINNALLAASPLIQGQKQSIGDLLNFGLTTAGNQGNLLTGAAAAEAGGIVGASNARQQGIGNLLNIGALLAAGGAFGGSTPAAPVAP